MKKSPIYNKCQTCGREFLNEGCTSCQDYLRGLCTCNKCYGCISDGCGNELTIKMGFEFR